MAIDNKLAMLCLIACDDSYQNNWNIGVNQTGGEALHTFPDMAFPVAPSQSNEPDVIPTQLMSNAGIAFTNSPVHGNSKGPGSI